MRVLIACEFSGVVREAFNAYHGVHAVSCDLLPAEDGRTDYHYKGDVRDILYDGWDLVLAFPPCTDLAVSGARWFKQKRADGRQQKSIDFFMIFTRLKCRWVIENPVGIMSTHYRKPDQIVQPYFFGDPFTKTTCLWLNGLPPLNKTRMVEKGERITFKSGKSHPKWYADALKLPADERMKARSRTFPGLAMAMADQWRGCAE